MPVLRRATGPGRVNLIGDHTDYNQGLALPMAIDLGVSVQWKPSNSTTLVISSSAFEDHAELLIGPGAGIDPATVEPRWARLVAAMVTLVPPASGGVLRIESTLPVGSGLSSSAALSVALAEVFGATGSSRSIASVCQEAEHRCGVPVGAMDPLICAGGYRDHALLIDFATMSTTAVAVPADADIVVIDSGRQRDLRDSPYATRVEECRIAAAVIGPLGLAARADLEAVDDPVLHRRCRHVVTECERVRGVVDAFGSSDVVAAGALMTESHRSLADDFEVSTPAIDALVDRLVSTPGVLGARLTGAGFGGCVVALCQPGTVDLATFGPATWHVAAADGTVAMRNRPGL